MLICQNPKTGLYVRDISFLNDENTFIAAYETVSSKRKAKIDKLKQPEDKCRSLCAELLLWDSLKEFCGFDTEPDIEYGSNSKPYLKNAPGVYFNISHSGDYVICAVSEHEVGCDIQKRGTAKDSELKLAERFFTEKEAEYIGQGADNIEIQTRFYDMWALKESYIKALGTGIQLPLQSFEVVIKGENVILATKNTDDKKHHLCLIDIVPEYSCAVCIEL